MWGMCVALIILNLNNYIPILGLLEDTVDTAGWVEDAWSMLKPFKESIASMVPLWWMEYVDSSYNIYSNSLPLARFCHQKWEHKKCHMIHQIHSCPGIVHPKFWRVTAVMRRLTCGPWVAFSSCCCLGIRPSMAVIAKREARTIIGFSIGYCESKAIKLPKQIFKNSALCVNDFPHQKRSKVLQDFA